MGLLQKIKAFFGIKDRKMLEAPKEEIHEVTKKPSLLEESENLTKSRDIVDALRVVGCKKDVLFEVSKFNETEKENLKNIIITLKNLGYSKLKISVILNGNASILKMDNDVLLDNIHKLYEYLKDKESVSDIIYAEPFILNINIVEKIEELKSVFEKFEIDFQNQKYILEENPNIFLLDHDRFIESLNVITESVQNTEEFLDEILSNPLIIGIIDKRLLAAHF